MPETPYYVFDIDELNKRIDGIKSRLPKNAQLCYAIKANPFVLNYIKDQDLLFEVCSPGELSICQKYGVNPAKIVFSGVCKTQQDVDRAYALQVKTITLESVLHCQFLVNTVNNSAKVHNQEVIIRLTGGNQFGMSSDDVEKCVDMLKTLPGIVIRGIHFFTGTQKKINKIQEEVSFIQQYCQDLMTKKNISFDSIEYGPGLSFNYFSSDDEKSNYSELELFAQFIKDSSFNYVIELGRYIASSCGSYYTQIMDVKQNGNSNYIIIDGGINHINYYGQMMGMKLPPVTHAGAASNTSPEKYTICGSLCTTADIVLRELKLCSPKTGDVLCFGNIGAYSVTEGIYLFLSHPLPQIYVAVNGQLIKVRDSKETSEINS